MKMRTLCKMLVTLSLASCLLQGCHRQLPADSPAAPAAEAQFRPGTDSGEDENKESGDGQAPAESASQASTEPTAAKLPTERMLETAPLSETQASIPSPSVTGALHVEGTKLCGSDGKPVQLKGISTHGLAWFPDYVNEECFAQFRTQWDVNVIRLALYTAEYNGYCSGGDQNQLKALVHSGVTYATNQDMYVIIDWHILSDSNPNQHISEATAFFDEMSRAYADHNNVLYEICNEPNGGTTWGDIKTYANTVIDVIRKNDRDAVIIVGTPNWSQYVDQAASDPITGFDNIMYSLHFYAATHKEDLRGKMVSAIQSGLPIFVTEYGICDASGNGGIDRGQAQQWIALMDQNDISYVAWNLSNKGETSAILDSSCTKTSGFSESDLSESGRWLHHMLTTKDLPASSGSPNSESSQPDTNHETHGDQTSQAPADTASDFSVSSDTLEINGKLVTQWMEQDHQVCQYTLTIRNISGDDCSGWAAQLLLPGEFTLVSGWNGQYRAQENSLYITSMDYNSHIPAGGSVSDVGFIVKFH